MKFKIGLITLLIAGAMLAGGSAFAANEIEVSLVDGVPTTGWTVLGAAAYDGIPALTVTLTNNAASTAYTVTGIRVTEAGTGGYVDGDLKVDAWIDENENGILDSGDTNLTSNGGSPTPVALDANATGETVLAFDVNDDNSFVLAAGASKQLIVTVSSTLNFLNTETAKVIFGVSGVGGGAVQTTTNGHDTVMDIASNPSSAAEVGTLTSSSAAAQGAFAAASTVAAVESGNKAQNVELVGGTFTVEATDNVQVVSTLGIIDSPLTASTAAPLTDVDTYYVYLEGATTLGEYGDDDTLLATKAGEALATTFALDAPLAVAPGATANFLIVADLSGEAGVAGEEFKGDATEFIRVDIDDGTSVINGAANTQGNVTGEAITLVPLFITNIQTQDIDGDGALDALKLTFSDNVNDVIWGNLDTSADLWIEKAGGNNAVGVDDATLVGFTTYNTVDDAAYDTIIYQKFTSSSLATSDRGTDGLPQIGVAANNWVLSADGDKSLLAFDPAGAPAGPAGTPWGGAVAATIEDAASPIVYSVTTGDTDSDGTIDQLTVNFSEAMEADNPNSWPGVTFSDPVFGTYTPTAGTVSGSSIVYTVTEKSQYDTESRPSFQYDPSVGDLRDASNTATNADVGNNAANNIQAEVGPEVEAGVYQQTPTKDQAPPVIVSAVTKDVYNDERYAGGSNFETKEPNGRIDTIVLTFSEAIQYGTGFDIDDAVTKMQLGYTAVNDLTATVFTAAAASTTAPFAPAPVLANSGTYGSNDTNAVLTVYFKEKSFAAGTLDHNGDTGTKVKYQFNGYTTGEVTDMATPVQKMKNHVAAQTSTDGAAPFIVDGMKQLDGEAKNTKEDDTVDNADAEVGGWDGNLFSNVRTLDTVSTAADPHSTTVGSDYLTGDGYIDAFKVIFSETVTIADDELATDWEVTNADDYSEISIVGYDVDQDGNRTENEAGATGSSVIIYGTSTEVANMWDTGLTPTVKWVGSDNVRDAASNDLANTAGLVSFDTAKPVPVFSLGIATDTKIQVTWSEEIYSADDGNTTPAVQDWSGTNSAAMFGYFDDTTVADENNSSLDATNDNMTWTSSSNIMTITTSDTLYLADVSADSIWVKSTTYIYDGASGDGSTYIPALSTSNQAIASTTRPGYAITIDDTIAPYISVAEAIDVTGDGWIDYIRLVMSENVDDSSIAGYTTTNAMSGDVSANWMLSGYTGALYFNFFEGGASTAAAVATAEDAAFAAGEAIFSDNALDDDILYIKIGDPSQIPSTTGMGSTDYAPTLSWGAGVTLSDMKPSNTLDTVKSDDSAADITGPVLMAAEYTANNMMQVTMSEPVTLSSVDRTDFAWLMNNAGLSPEDDYTWAKYITEILQPSPGILTLRVSDAGKLQVGDNYGKLSVAAAPSMTDALETPNSAQAANAAGDVNTNGYFVEDPTTSPNTLMTAAGGNAIAVGVTAWDAAANNGFVKNYIDIPVFTLSSDGGGGPVVSTVEPPTNMVLTQPAWDDNGHWFKASFTPSTTSGVTSYQFYLQNAADPNDVRWEYFGYVQSAYANADGKMDVYVASPVNGEGLVMGVAAFKGGDTSTMASKAAADGEVLVATIVDGAAKAAAGEVSELVTGTVDVIDEIAFSALETYAAADVVDSDTGIVVSWTAPADHGQVGEWRYAGMGAFPVYGVEKYNVYRSTDGETFELAGTASSGATQFIDSTVEAGSTVYQYKVEMVDGNPAHTLETAVRSALAQTGFTGDFNADGVVGTSDFAIFANNYSSSFEVSPTTFLGAMDLNADGTVGTADFAIFANAYGSTLKAAKAAIAEMPEAQVPMAVSASIDEETSSFFVNVNIEKNPELKGFEFFLSYDETAVEFIENSVSGLVGLHLTKVEDGLVRVSDWFVGEEFDGVVSVGFKSMGLNRTIDFGIEAAVVDLTGNGKLAAVTDITDATVKAIPTVYSLSQNYPNPFNPTTTIDYSIPRSGNVDLVIYNMAGQKVRTLISGHQDASFYKVVWDGRNDMGESVASGLYFYRLNAGSFSKIEKMTLVK